jgi:hypothetical protein
MVSFILFSNFFVQVYMHLHLQVIGIILTLYQLFFFFKIDLKPNTIVLKNWQMINQLGDPIKYFMYLVSK